MNRKQRLIWSLFLSMIFVFNSAFIVVGHRGDPTKYPEETIQSDNSAFNSGADYVELDLHLSSDHVLVISHDDDLSRVLGSSVIVSQNKFATLSKYTYPNGEHVLSLDQLFTYYQNRPNTKFVLETKVDHGLDPTDTLERLLAETIKRHHMEKRVMIHSFSGKSLTFMKQLLPQVPVIFIVGSLKRINFKILQTVDAVNVSSDLIKKYPDLVKWIHGMNKKIFIWAEMDESPSLWNWLINNNVDGVVTNFPSLGFRYKVAKEGANQFKIDQDAYFLRRSKAATIMNPYIKVPAKKVLHPFELIHIKSGVWVNNHLYYQLGEKTFVPADFISLSLTPSDLAPIINSALIVKNQAVNFYNAPDRQAQVLNLAKPFSKYQILGYSGSLKSMWFSTSKGWLKAADVLLTGYEANQVTSSINLKFTNLALQDHWILQEINVPTLANQLLKVAQINANRFSK